MTTGLTCPCCGTRFVKLSDQRDSASTESRDGPVKSPEGSDYDIDALVDELRSDAETRPDTVEEMNPFNDPTLW